MVDNMESTSEQSTEKRKRWSEVWDWLKAIIVALIIAEGIHLFILQQFVVDGHSMDRTLANGEHLIVDKVPYYFETPKRGDIIVFHAPDGEDWVKRVIGLPGNTVAVKDGKLILDGKVINEPYINQPMNPYNNYGPTTVPKGDLFVMGDNRNISEDSRIIGPIPISKVIGRVDLVFWPLNDFKVIGTTQEKYLPQTTNTAK